MSSFTVEKLATPLEVAVEPPPVNVAPLGPLAMLKVMLSDALDTRVKVEVGKQKGKIVVEFASLEDLQRIVTTMSPEWAQSLTA